MQEILSQNEIDSLLQALSTGDIPKDAEASVSSPKARNYDFRRPNKFSKEHLRTLEMLHQQFARHLSSFLSGYLRTNINIELASVGQIIYDEFIRSVPTPTILTVFDLQPLEGASIMETNTGFVFPIIDLLFGGNGSSSEMNRELTDIEIQVIRKMMSRILELLAPTWQDIYEINPSIRAIETNPRLQQLYSPNEVVALLTFTVTMGENDQGMINLCLPYIMLDPVIARLSVRQQFIRQYASGKRENYQKIIHWLSLCNVDITAVIGEATITVDDFLQLQSGDVIVLDNDVHHDLGVYIGDSLKLDAQAGSVGENLAIQIVSLNEREG